MVWARSRKCSEKQYVRPEDGSSKSFRESVPMYWTSLSLVCHKGGKQWVSSKGQKVLIYIREHQQNTKFYVLQFYNWKTYSEFTFALQRSGKEEWWNTSIKHSSFFFFKWHSTMIRVSVQMESSSSSVSSHKNFKSRYAKRVNCLMLIPWESKHVALYSVIY